MSQPIPSNEPSQRNCHIVFPRRVSFEPHEMPHPDPLEADDYFKSLRDNAPLAISLRGETSFAEEVQKAQSFARTRYPEYTFDYCGVTILINELESFDSISRKYLNEAGETNKKGVFVLKDRQGELLDNSVMTALTASQLLNVDQEDCPVPVRFTHGNLVTRYEPVTVMPEDSAKDIFQKVNDARVEAEIGLP